MGHRWKNAKKGLQFTLMVVGCSGLGRTTFVNTLCGKQVLEDAAPPEADKAHAPRELRITQSTVGTRCAPAARRLRGGYVPRPANRCGKTSTRTASACR